MGMCSPQTSIVVRMNALCLVVSPSVIYLFLLCLYVYFGAEGAMPP